MRTASLPSRAFALFGALGLFSFASAGMKQLPIDSATLGEGVLGTVFATALMVLAPIAVALALIWWAWRGWQLHPQPRWITAVRWGFAGGLIWAIAGTIGYAAWLSWVQRTEVGNLVGLIPALTAPIGFVIGAVIGWLRAPRA
jgi:hypothetical protein